MKVVQTIEELRSLDLSNIGFVPTMGALHTGHVSLLDLVADCETRLLSIFVNPTQFGPSEDFANYPRTVDTDLETAREAGVDVVFLPTAEEMYRQSHTSIDVGNIASIYEGAIRPGHLQGVATVVAKLFNIVRPSVAAFGLKDLQQCAVVSQMVRDLNFPVQLTFGETKRDANGLALSSRNRYLSAEDQLVAADIYRTMTATKAKLRANEEVASCLLEAREHLAERGFVVDYFDLISFANYESISKVIEDAYLIVAVRLKGVRLIDNLQVWRNC